MSNSATRDRRFNDAQEALDAFKCAAIGETAVLAQLRDSPGINRSVAVAKAKRINRKSREEVADVVTEGVEL